MLVDAVDDVDDVDDDCRNDEADVDTHEKKIDVKTR